jgi:hypothetical protein
MLHMGKKPVGDVNLPPELASPARRALVRAGYTDLDQLAGASAADLSRLHGMGGKAIGQIRVALAQRGQGLSD